MVALKNLQKKDSTTKSKALEDLQVYVLSLAVESGGVEEAILEPWVGLVVELRFFLTIVI